MWTTEICPHLLKRSNFCYKVDCQLVKMKLSITVQYKSEIAHYSVIQEAAGVYLASLERYEGPLSEAPPSSIMLVKGIRRWTGSFEHQEVLDKLGVAIEACLNLERTKNNPQEKTTLSPSSDQ
jgi:hypothetical protein